MVTEARRIRIETAETAAIAHRKTARINATMAREATG